MNGILVAIAIAMIMVISTVLVVLVGTIVSDVRRSRKLRDIERHLSRTGCAARGGDVSTASIDRDRLQIIRARKLAKGGHQSIDHGMCVMEAVSFVAGEPWSDHPQCACPVLGEFMRVWNDCLPDDDRQMLIPYVERLVGTRATPEVESRRAWMSVDWLVREYTPAWLRLAGLTDHAHALESLAPVLDTASATASMTDISAACSAACSAARSAADSAADSAACSAAYSAACSAARSAADSAARSAARSAADSAADSAACSAADSAARSAADSAAYSALSPTVKALQASALLLLDRMIACGE